MTLDVGEALSNDTTNYRHHHDHHHDMTLDVGETLSNDATNHRHHHGHHLDMTLDVGAARRTVEVEQNITLDETLLSDMYESEQPQGSIHF